MNNERLGARGRLWCAISLCLIVAASCAGRGGNTAPQTTKTLARHVDDLLEGGNIGEANRKLSNELPELVRAGQTSQIDEVASVLQKRSDELPTSVQRTSVESYFEGINQRLSDLPLDDICSVATSATVPPSAEASLQEVVEHIGQQEQRRNAREFCALLGLEL